MKPWEITILLITSILLISCGALQNETPGDALNGEAESARQTLVTFLDDLYTAKYEQAVELYGGSYQTMIEQNLSVDPDDHAALLSKACEVNGAQCLEVKRASLVLPVESSQFKFSVEFLKEDGSLFVLGPCCGGNETDSPSQTLFEFIVLKSGDDEFLVMDMPPYMP